MDFKFILFPPSPGSLPTLNHQSNLLYILSCPRPRFKLFLVSRLPLSPTHFCSTELLFPSSSVHIFRFPQLRRISPPPRPGQCFVPPLERASWSSSFQIYLAVCVLQECAGQEPLPSYHTSWCSARCSAHLLSGGSVHLV